MQLQSEIRKTYPKKIELGKQGKHIEGNNNYTDGKSKLSITLEEAQELVDKYAGSGAIHHDRSGKWSRKEQFVFNKPIGIVKDKDNNWVETNKAMMHYSKKGTHIVPTLKEDIRNDRK